MAKVIQLDTSETSKLGYKRAKRKKSHDLEREGQLNLFVQAEARIIQLPSRFTPFEEALWLDEKGDPGAQEAYLKAIFAEDCIADANCNLGILETQTGNTVKAFDYFTECLKYEPRHLEAHYNLANLYFEQEDYRLAKLHYEIAAEIEPEFPNIYFNLALVYALNEEYEDAFNALIKYKSLVPKEDAVKADGLLSSLKKSLTE
ncbi:MAG TPA: tetratricopeptide repeat protein [Ignavibacteriaceae bacterium]